NSSGAGITGNPLHRPHDHHGAVVKIVDCGEQEVAEAMERILLAHGSKGGAGGPPSDLPKLFLYIIDEAPPNAMTLGRFLAGESPPSSIGTKA
ncbi:MAG: hypothetical protein L0Y70_03725, partial [Gemmataceae bacterium]|nr:hypothetical protein [Gemmataceae bacterium]